MAIRAAIENKMQGKRLAAKINNYRQWTHVQTYGTHVFAMDMLSSIFQASGDKSMKPIAFCLQIFKLTRHLINSFFFKKSTGYFLKGKMFQNYLRPEIYKIKIKIQKEM